MAGLRAPSTFSGTTASAVGSVPLQALELLEDPSTPPLALLALLALLLGPSEPSTAAVWVGGSFAFGTFRLLLTDAEAPRLWSAKGLKGGATATTHAHTAKKTGRAARGMGQVS